MNIHISWQPYVIGIAVKYAKRKRKRRWKRKKRENEKMAWDRKHVCQEKNVTGQLVFS